METLEQWLDRRGPLVARALEQAGESICATVSAQLRAAFPTLCYDERRSDAESFQQLTYRQVPHRLHRVVQVLLEFGTFTVIEREYDWGWQILPKYGVRYEHFQAVIRWYFAAARELAQITPGDTIYLETIEIVVAQLIDRAAPPHLLPPGLLLKRSNGTHDR